jgi:hypothetical protein
LPPLPPVNRSDHGESGGATRSRSRPREQEIGADSLPSRSFSEGWSALRCLRWLPIRAIREIRGQLRSLRSSDQTILTADWAAKNAENSKSQATPHGASLGSAPSVVGSALAAGPPAGFPFVSVFSVLKEGSDRMFNTEFTEGTEPGTDTCSWSSCSLLFSRLQPTAHHLPLSSPHPRHPRNPWSKDWLFAGRRSAGGRRAWERSHHWCSGLAGHHRHYQRASRPRVNQGLHGFHGY